MYKHWCPGTGGLCREKEYVDETCTDSLVRGPATNTLRISAIKRKISRGDEARNKRSEGGEIFSAGLARRNSQWLEMLRPTQKSVQFLGSWRGETPNLPPITMYSYLLRYLLSSAK